MNTKTAGMPATAGTPTTEGTPTTVEVPRTERMSNNRIQTTAEHNRMNTKNRRNAKAGTKQGIPTTVETQGKEGFQRQQDPAKANRQQQHHEC